MASPTYAGAHFFRFASLPKLHPRGYFRGLDFAGGIYSHRERQCPARLRRISGLSSAALPSRPISHTLGGIIIYPQ